jgi:hypothetical protein
MMSARSWAAPLRRGSAAARYGLLVAIVVAGCGPAMTSPNGPAASTMGDHAWTVLFDGRSTGAFRAYGGDDFPSAAWAIDGDALRTIPGAPVDIISIEAFGDFELEFTWRVARGGNGGVMYRVAETSDPPWTSGPEYQVLDDLGHPDGQDPRTSAAALYALIAPGEGKRLEPVGSWNEGRIVVQDGRVEHWLNGAVVVAYDWDGPDVRALIEASKFRDLDRFMRVDDGHVAFQHHGEEVSYARIRIRRL